MLNLSTSLAQSSEAQLANEYYINGDQEKALSSYKKVVKNKADIQYVHANYFAMLVANADYKEAQKYLAKVTKLFPGKLEYQADVIYLFHLRAEENNKANYIANLSESLQNNQYQLNQLSQMMSARDMHLEAKKFLLLARVASKNSRAYALELAALYRLLDEKENMINEYINYGLINNRNTNYVKNLFQMLLTGPDDFDQLRDILIKRVQQDPDQLSYLELLIWINLQQKDFYGAFVQAKAMDRRKDKPGDESMRVAEVATNNKSWEDAEYIYQYIVNTYPDSYHYTKARLQLINVQKNSVINKYPVDQENLLTVVNAYQQLFDELGPTTNTYEAIREKCFLLAYYLNMRNQAIAQLIDLTSNPSLPRKISADCKLLLGDIYLLINEPWEASLLYGQVQKAHKYDQMGYDARLRNARLYYFTGDFALANSYLKILKRASTKKVANNAIDLGLLISNNTILDTTDLAMQAFAKVELLNYQNKKDSSVLALEKFLVLYPNHSLTDEAYYLLSNIKLELGEYQAAITYLNRLSTNYAEDILGDDAAFLKASIYEDYLKDMQKAQELYRIFLSDYPGSLYVSEVRKRFRTLRGDTIN
ncbi:MAG: tetratricopeptide repeat protein [Cyclobacteriaceae bacterium]